MVSACCWQGVVIHLCEKSEWRGNEWREWRGRERDRESGERVDVGGDREREVEREGEREECGRESGHCVLQKGKLFRDISSSCHMEEMAAESRLSKCRWSCGGLDTNSMQSAPSLGNTTRDETCEGRLNVTYRPIEDFFPQSE